MSSSEPIIRGDSLYTIVEGPTWEEAEANANKLGGNLVTINDAEENEFFLSEDFSYPDPFPGTVGELRNELSIPTDAKVMVQGTVRTNDYELSEDEVVAYASNNKVGG